MNKIMNKSNIFIHEFRAKSLETGEWVYGDLVHGSDGSTYIVTTIWFDVDPNTVSEFTRIKDFKGNKIFEGDIIQDSEGNTQFSHLVGFDYDRGCFCADLIEPGVDKRWVTSSGLYKDWIDEFTKVVIGNKWDNPELVKNFL